MSDHPNKPQHSQEKTKSSMLDVIKKYQSQIQKALISLVGIGAVAHMTSTPDADFLKDKSLSDVAGDVSRHPGSRIGYAQTANIFHALYQKVGNITNSRIGNVFAQNSEANFMDEVKNIRYSLTAGHEDGHEVLQITTTNTNTGKQEVLKLTCQDGLPVTLNGPIASYQEILDVLDTLKKSGSFAELEQDTPLRQMILLLGLIIAGGYYTIKTEKKKSDHDDRGHNEEKH